MSDNRNKEPSVEYTMARTLLEADGDEMDFRQGMRLMKQVRWSCPFARRYFEENLEDVEDSICPELAWRAKRGDHLAGWYLGLCYLEEGETTAAHDHFSAAAIMHPYIHLIDGDCGECGDYGDFERCRGESDSGDGALEQDFSKLYYPEENREFWGRREKFADVQHLGEGSLTAYLAQKKSVSGGLPLERISQAAGIAMRLIPAGTFEMGDQSGFADQKPAHTVNITEPFWMAHTPVTREQYCMVMGGELPDGEERNYPAVNVSWEAATEFCAKVTELARRDGSIADDEVYSLPTEAQWEYACRAGTFDQFCAQLDLVAWYCRNSGGGHEVGRKLPNGFGLYDMHGYVWEWCDDWYDEFYYERSPADDPPGPESGQRKVVRGGTERSAANICSSASRYNYSPGVELPDIGFRPVLKKIPND